MTTTSSVRQPSPAEELDSALCRRILYGALSQGLHAPTAEIVERLRASETADAILEAARYLTGRSSVSETVEQARPGAVVETPAREEERPQLLSRVREFVGTLRELELESLQRLHARMFGHTARGRVCPYESEFGQNSVFVQTSRLANLGGFYAAFGLQPSRLERERVDHISCELEFLEFLAQKEAYALGQQDDEMLKETRKATRLFQKEHLSRFARAFAHLLACEDPGGFYGTLANVLFDFVTLECRRLGVPAGTPFVKLREVSEGDVQMECGADCGPSACEPSEETQVQP